MLFSGNAYINFHDIIGEIECNDNMGLSDPRITLLTKQDKLIIVNKKGIYS
jgi:hypothetical protein